MKNARQRLAYQDVLDVPDVPHFIVDEDEPSCAEYVLMCEQGNVPALQEYMLELQAHIAYR